MLHVLGITPGVIIYNYSGHIADPVCACFDRWALAAYQHECDMEAIPCMAGPITGLSFFCYSL